MIPPRYHTYYTPNAFDSKEFSTFHCLRQKTMGKTDERGMLMKKKISFQQKQFDV